MIETFDAVVVVRPVAKAILREMHKTYFKKFDISSFSLSRLKHFGSMKTMSCVQFFLLYKMTQENNQPLADKGILQMTA